MHFMFISKGGTTVQFPEFISRNTSINTKEVVTAMLNRDAWCGVMDSMKATTVEQ